MLPNEIVNISYPEVEKEIRSSKSQILLFRDRINYVVNLINNHDKQAIKSLREDFKEIIPDSLPQPTTINQLRNFLAYTYHELITTEINGNDLKCRLEVADYLISFCL